MSVTFFVIIKLVRHIKWILGDFGRKVKINDFLLELFGTFGWLNETRPVPLAFYTLLIYNPANRFKKGLIVCSQGAET